MERGVSGQTNASSRAPLGLIALTLIAVGGAVALVAGRPESGVAARARSAQREAPGPSGLEPGTPDLEPGAPRSAPEARPKSEKSDPSSPKPPSYSAELERATLAVEEGRYTEAANRLSVLAAQHLSEEGQQELQHCLQRTRVFSEPGFTKRCAWMVTKRLQEAAP